VGLTFYIIKLTPRRPQRRSLGGGQNFLTALRMLIYYTVWRRRVLDRAICPRCWPSWLLLARNPFIHLQPAGTAIFFTPLRWWNCFFSCSPLVGVVRSRQFPVQLGAVEWAAGDIRVIFSERRPLACTSRRLWWRPTADRLGLAIVPLCRGTGTPPSTNTGAPWPLRNFLIIMVTISVDRQHYR